jgi:hypothetical protein
MNTELTLTDRTRSPASAARTSSPPPSADDVWTVERIRALGVTTTLATAASVLGISRSQAYRLAATGTFQTPLIRAGTRIIVPIGALLRLLLADDAAGPAPDQRRLDPGSEPSVDATTTPPADYAHHRWRHRAEHPGDDE